MAMENPDRFVLKPQREGGGNNMYGDEIKEVCVIYPQNKMFINSIFADIHIIMIMHREY